MAPTAASACLIAGSRLAACNTVRCQKDASKKPANCGALVCVKNSRACCSRLSCDHGILIAVGTCVGGLAAIALSFRLALGAPRPASVVGANGRRMEMHLSQSLRPTTLPGCRLARAMHSSHGALKPACLPWYWAGCIGLRPQAPALSCPGWEKITQMVSANSQCATT